MPDRDRERPPQAPAQLLGDRRPSGGARRCSRWPPWRTTCPRAGSPRTDSARSSSALSTKGARLPRLRSTKRATASSSPDSADSVGTKNGFGRKRTSSTMSASAGMPCLNPNDSSVTERSPSRASVALLDQRPQHVHGERAGVDQGVGSPAAARPASRARRAMPARMSVSDSGCRRRVSEKRRMQDLVGGVEEQHLHRVPRLPRMSAKIRRAPARKSPPRASMHRARRDRCRPGSRRAR